MHLYTADPIGAMGPYVNLTIDAGTQPAAVLPRAAPASPPTRAGRLFNGTLAGFSAAAQRLGGGGVGDRGGRHQLEPR